MDAQGATSQAQAAGKLYLAGEYAVVESGHPAILVAVDRMLTAQVSEPAAAASAAGKALEEQTGSIQSAGHSEASTLWHRENGLLTADKPSTQPSYVMAAATTVEELALERGVALRAFDLNISSQLDAGSGKKYGLGSSAAVAVATVRALLSFYGLELDPLQTYKLAYLATGRAQSLGSGGDLAASLFGGCIRFTSPDRAWVRQQLGQAPLSQLIEQAWPDLSIARIDAFGLGSPLQLLVGWTGSPASTPSLVASVKQGSGDGKREAYERFLAASDSCVDAIAVALSSGDMHVIGDLVAQARSLLRSLSALTDTDIETPALRTLVETALLRGAAAKSSGAGGGDCGIAIVGQPETDVLAASATAGERTDNVMNGSTVDAQSASGASRQDAPMVPGDSRTQAHAIATAWARAGIEPLDLHVSQSLAPLDRWNPASQATKE
ncbi:phosphomevalonate kinase [Bombiscardovia nodaiensis]|uniref:phosphomevalonate kinase n=1 Tax=Bombiscardovia nodaiensis TaxID=2932181 RepID=A0ABN6SBR8_9BIFI|nr:phosphomevalonate kinase [Bombiscardovia nodaiensis]